jgi:hypothetical protein
MGRRIENRDQLREEILRLERRKAELTAALKNDVEEIKDEFNFYRIITGIVSKIGRVRISKDLFTADGFFSELKSILKQILLRKGVGMFTNKIYSGIFGLIAWLYNRRRKKK